MSKKLTTEEFQNRLNKIYGNQFMVLSDYINNETKIDILCNKCGNIIQKQPAKMTDVTYVLERIVIKRKNLCKRKLMKNFPIHMK